MNYVDPDGKLAFLAAPLIGAAGGALSDVVIQGIGLWLDGCDPLDYKNYDWSDVAVSAAFGAAIPGPLSALKKVHGRYKKLKGAPRNLNKQPYAKADAATWGDVLGQLGRGAAAAGVKVGVDKGLEHYEKKNNN